MATVSLPAFPATETATAEPCLWCPLPSQGASTLCAECGERYRELRRDLSRSFPLGDGPTFNWRGLHVQADPECERIVAAHVDCPIEFLERFGYPLDNEHALEVAREALREQASDLISAFDAEADAWVDEMVGEALIARAEDS